MSHLEPTYLRYIYDGLIKGSIHPDNAAELPERLIGLYEEAFDERQPVHKRQQLLERFAIWALLKKEVSIQFIAEVLSQPEEEIQEFIATYSAWFNSPESGKYQLYHERLKVFLLQKFSGGEIAELNNQIIQFLSLRFSVIQKNESTLYCYQYLSHHAYVAAKINADSNLLSELCLSESFKKRQFDLSGFYDWEEQLMQLGVEYFALKEDAICHEIVFEKTKIQYKKKDIDLILSLVQRGEMETVLRFFQNTTETSLYARVELAYFYFLAFFEIFEKSDSTFSEKKEMAIKLLEIFEDNFKWDRGYYLSQFVDVNISFRLHCYFEQYGLNYLIIAVLSSNQAFDEYYEFQLDEPLKFISSNHIEEANFILKDFKKFDYGIKDNNLDGIINYEYKGLEHEKINKELREKILNFSKTQLVRDELAYSSDISESFEELYSFIISTLRKIDVNRDIKLKVLREYKNLLKINTSDLFSIKGNFENSEGKNTLQFVKNDIEETKGENKSLPLLISEGLLLEEFMTLEIYKRFKLISDESLDCYEDIELMLFFMELSEYYQKVRPTNLLDLLSVLLVEFHLNMNDEFIEIYIDNLRELISSSADASEEFEGKFYLQLLDFFNRKEINGHFNNLLKLIQDILYETYFDFSFYKYSFVAGCKLINLFSQYKIDFPEEDIFERILEDLDYLIEENDYNEMWVIEMSRINNIFQKAYFPDFYNAVKRIQIEQVRVSLVEYIFEDILLHKGTNYNTVIFFKDKATDYPGMFKWAIKRLSKKLSETNQLLSYLPISQDIDLLMERLLLNIVSSREQLKKPLNIHILKHYGLDWIFELDNEYEILISEH
jgi:hypothetical protein